MKWLYLLGFLYCVNFSTAIKPYVRHHFRRYGYEGYRCTDSTECFSTAYRCNTGTCQKIDHVRIMGMDCTEKLSRGVCWIPGTISNRKYAVKTFQYLLGPAEYICRVSNGDTTIHGKLIYSLIHPDVCMYVWRGRIYESADYELLVNSGSQVWASGGYSMDTAVVGGFDENGKPALICRAFHRRFFTKLIGKETGWLTAPDYNVCQFTRFGVFYENSQFDILVNE